MNFHKLIITNKYLRYTPFWCWYRLINHEDYRLDDRFRYQDFWNSINEGYAQMVEDDKWMTYFGAKPQKMYVSQEAYDELMRRINEPSDPKVMERFREILNKKAPWDDEE
jgi:hypothetical protein